MTTKKTITFYYRGMIERGANYEEGYSAQSENDCPLYPWSTKRECQTEASNQGAIAVFVHDDAHRIAQSYEIRRAIELAAEKVNAEKRTRIVREVAQELGDGYTRVEADTRNDRDMIQTPDGLRFYMSKVYGADTKFNISGDYHREKLWEHKSYNAKIPGISVSITRTPKAIAADIKRRFLPEFEALIAAMRESKASSEAREDLRMKNTRRLALAAGKALKIDTDYHNSAQEMPRLSVTSLVEGYVHIDVSTDTCTIEIGSVPLDIAEAFCKLLAKRVKT